MIIKTAIFIQITVLLPPQNSPLVKTEVAILKSPSKGRENTLVHTGQTNRSYLYWKPKGRLGNQIFEFASMFCVAQQSDHIPTIDRNSSLLSLFRIPDAVRLDRKPNNETVPSVSEFQCCFLQPHILDTAINISGELQLMGFFHSYRYMLPCWGTVKPQLMLRADVQLEAEMQMKQALIGSTASRRLLESAQKDGKAINETFTFIGVHVRRGDRSHTYPPISFFKRAFKYYEDGYPNVAFFVCSDDIEWCITELPGALHRPTTSIFFMSDKTKDYRVDFGILMNCQHSVVTSGTFSWWSGWLAGGEVVYHTGYDKWQQREHSERFKHTDFYPPDWIAMN